MLFVPKQKKVFANLFFCPMYLRLNLGLLLTHMEKNSLGSLQVPSRKIQWCFHLKHRTIGKNSILIVLLRNESFDQGPNSRSLAIRQDFPFMRSFRSLTAELFCNTFAQDRRSFVHCSFWKDTMLPRKFIKGWVKGHMSIIE